MAIKTESLLVFCGFFAFCFTAPSNISVEATTQTNHSCPEHLVQVCEFGARLYKLSVYDAGDRDVLTECYSGCNDSYSNPEGVDGCKNGCLSQHLLTESSPSGLDEFRNTANKLIQKAQMEQLMSHWMFEMLTGFDVFNDWYDGRSDNIVQETDVDISTYLVVEQSGDTIHVSQYKIIQPIDMSDETAQTSAPASDTGNLYSDSKDEDFEPCMNLSEYSRILFCLLLLSSGLVLLWLSCTSVATAPKQRVFTKKPSPSIGQVVIMIPVDKKLASVHQSNKGSAADDDDVKLIEA